MIAKGDILVKFMIKFKKKFFAKDFNMKRKEQRLLKKLEIEPVKGLMKTCRHFYAGLQNRLNKVADPRDNRYTSYNCATLIGTGITKISVASHPCSK